MILTRAMISWKICAMEKVKPLVSRGGKLEEGGTTDNGTIISETTINTIIVIHFWDVIIIIAIVIIVIAIHVCHHRHGRPACFVCQMAQ